MRQSLRLLGFIAALIAPSMCYAQVLQTGSVTPGHAATWATNGVIQDGGPLGGITWPSNGDLVVSNGTDTPAGLALINGNVLTGVGGAWLPQSLTQLPWSTALSSGTCTNALVLNSLGTLVLGPCGGGGAVSSVSNADGTLTVSPTTGAVVASLALGHANTWTGVQSFSNGSLQLLGASSGSSILEAPASGGGVVTLPSGSATLLSNALGNTDFLVGNASGVATPVSMSGSCSLANTGAVECLLGGSTIETFTLSGSTTKLATANGTLTNTHCVEIDASGNFVDAGGTCTTGGGGGTVTSGTGPAIAQYPAGTSTTVGPATVSGDATIAQGGALTVSKIGGVSIALGGALSTSSGFATLGAGVLTVSGPSSAATYTLPGSSDTLAGLGTIQTFTAAQSFTNGDLQLLGSSSGHSTIEAPATGGGIITLPSGAATLLGNALPSADMFVGNGSGVATGVAASGACTLANTGTFTCFGSSASTLPFSDLSGSLLAAQMPALTGDVTNTAGTLATTVGAIQGRTVPSGSTTNGQLLIGNTSTGNWSKATLTAGSNVTITNGPGTITIASTGGGGGSCPTGVATWDGTTNLTVSATTSLVYTIGSTPIAAARTLTLPVAASFGVNCVLSIVDNAQIFNSTNVVTPTRQSSDTIDGSTTGTPLEPAAPLIQTVEYVASASGQWNTLKAPSVGSVTPSSGVFLNGLSPTGFSTASACATSGTTGDLLTDNGAGGCNSQADVTVASNNLLINQNAAAIPFATSPLTIAGADSIAATGTIVSYGNLSLVTLLRSGGTGASPSAVGSNLVLGEDSFGGFDGIGWFPAPSFIAARSANAWSGTDHSTLLTFSTTPAASITPVRAESIESDGTIFAGSNASITANNTGLGTFNAATGYFVAGSALAIGNLAPVTGPVIVGRVTNTSGALSAAYTPSNGTDTTVAMAHSTFTAGDGVKANDTTGTIVDSGAAVGLTHFDIGYIAGVNMTTNPTEVSIALPVGMTISSMIGHVGAAVGGTATIDIYEAPSGTACASGTKLTNTTNFNANGTANTDQTLAGTTSTITSGDRLCLVAAGAGWSSSVGSGGITVWAHL